MKENERLKSEEQSETGRSVNEPHESNSSLPPAPCKRGEGPGIKIVTMQKVGDEIITT